MLLIGRATLRVRSALSNRVHIHEKPSLLQNISISNAETFPCPDKLVWSPCKKLRGQLVGSVVDSLGVWLLTHHVNSVNKCLTVVEVPDQSPSTGKYPQLCDLAFF
jgi:hypothetical protein